MLTNLENNGMEEIGSVTPTPGEQWREPWELFKTKYQHILLENAFENVVCKYRDRTVFH